MVTYPLILNQPSFSYEDHLMVNEYIGDIKEGIRQSSSEVVRGHALSTKILSQTINQNVNFLAKTVTSNADKISVDIQDLSIGMEFGLDKISEGISGLRADFNIGMGKVIAQFELMRSEVQAGLDHTIEILQNRRKSEAQEHFRDALEYYREGCKFFDKPQWFQDALKHFLASVERYERNPLAHLHIGHIYHYQKEQRDFEKALNHYRLCYTYGEADKKDYPVAAQGYFYAGWLQAAVFNNLPEAIKLAEECVKLDPKIGEAHFHIAKFSALLDQADQAIKHLRYAIENFDRNYYIKFSEDPDFDLIRDAVKKLFNQLKMETKAKFENELKKLDINFNFDQWDQLPFPAPSIRKAFSIIEEVRNKDNYFDYLDFLPKLKSLLYPSPISEIQQFDIFSNPDKYYEKASKIIHHFDDNFIENHVPFSPSYESELLKNLELIKEMLEKDDPLEIYEAYLKAIELQQRHLSLWMTKDEHMRRKKAKKEYQLKQKKRAAEIHIENEHRRITQEKRFRKEGLCLVCGEPLGYFAKLFGSHYCKKHRSNIEQFPNT